MEERVRELLRSMAADVPTHEEVPGRTARRARRGMAVSAVVLALIAAVAVSGGLMGLQALTGESPRTPGVVPPPAPAIARSCEWARVPSPNMDPETLTNSLRAVAAVEDDDIWAVGGFYHPAEEATGPTQPLTMHWDGIAWTIVPVPEVGSQYGLAGMAGVASDDVWAVGSASPEAGGDRPLTVHWDGTAWTEVASPDPGKPYSHLAEVAAVGPDDVWAVGNWATGRGQAGTLAMHWHGTAWSIVATPDPPPRPQVGWAYPSLAGIGTLGPNDVWAVGLSNNVAPTGPSNTLAMHWDGMAWTAVRSPDEPSSTGLPYNGLASVDGTAPGDVWAVGQYELDLNEDPYSFLPEASLVEHWDGTTWSVVPTPPLEGRNVLSGVVAVTGGEAWAVGWRMEERSKRAPYVERPVMERWDGTGWSVLSVPSVDEGALTAVTATPSGDLWAVGDAPHPGGQTEGTLTLRADCE
jgi:hypothetical protein